MEGGKLHDFRGPEGHGQAVGCLAPHGVLVNPAKIRSRFHNAQPEGHPG